MSDSSDYSMIGVQQSKMGLITAANLIYRQNALNSDDFTFYSKEIPSRAQVQTYFVPTPDALSDICQKLQKIKDDDSFVLFMEETELGVLEGKAAKEECAVKELRRRYHHGRQDTREAGAKLAAAQKTLARIRQTSAIRIGELEQKLEAVVAKTETLSTKVMELDEDLIAMGIQKRELNSSALEVHLKMNAIYHRVLLDMAKVEIAKVLKFKDWKALCDEVPESIRTNYIHSRISGPTVPADMQIPKDVIDFIWKKTEIRKHGDAVAHSGSEDNLQEAVLGIATEANRRKLKIIFRMLYGKSAE